MVHALLTVRRGFAAGVPAKLLKYNNLRCNASNHRLLRHKAYDLLKKQVEYTPTPYDRAPSMYQKPVLQKYGSFRELTLLGMNNSTDGASILGISSPGCSTTIGRWTFEIGCETGPSAS